jgi:tRNA threonylcarbamoyl adenosine modification protein (Sua5/YciO/YrdC/YwlC family)
METKVVKIDAGKIDTAEIKKAAQIVDSGGLVAFPTETVYGIACRVEAKSLAKLDDIKGRSPDKFYTLHIGQKEDAEKYVPRIGLRAKKLIKNGWPGPVTVVFELTDSDIKTQREKLKKEVFENLYKDNTIGIRCPDNEMAAILLQEAKEPIVAPSANRTGQQPATDAEQVLARFSGQIDLVLDGGPCKYRKSSTVVKIGKNGLEILREGVYSKEELDAMSKVEFLFVCTGNTCRSAMAEGIFRKELAEKLHCKVDQLGEIGYKVSSAGVLDIAGAPASDEAIAVCAERGIDIKAHKSRLLTRELIEKSDFIFVMTRGHCQRVTDIEPEAAGKCILLGADKEIADPIGQSKDFFRDCAGLIEKFVRERISGLWI